MDTIDNLGLEASARYARDRAMYDEKLITEADLVSRQTIVDVTTQSYRSEMESILGTDIKNRSFSEIKAPAGYNEQVRRLFMNRIVPSLGTEEKKTMQMERIQAQLEQDEKRLVAQPQSYERDKVMREEKKESSVLITLIQKSIELDHDLAEIHAKRAQYKKG